MGKAWAKFVKMILCTFIFGKSFLKRMDGHVIALKENVLGKSGMNTKNTLSLCDVIIFLGIYGVSFNDGKDDVAMIKCVDELQHILYGLQLDSN